MVGVFQTQANKMIKKAAVLFFLLSSTAFAQSINSPGNLSALVYSTSAAELFWTPADDTRTEIIRNNESLGITDARSLFQSGLSQNQDYQYTLRAVSSNGVKSAPISITLTTANFQPPIKRVQSDPTIISAATDVAPAPPPTQTPTPTQTQTVTVPTVQADATPAPNASNSNNCVASNVSSLLSCVRNANAYEQIDFQNSIQCTNNCCPSGGALLKLHGVHNLQIVGHGHRLMRSSNQRQCSLLDIENASNIQIASLTLDDDQSVAGCQVNDRCPRMLHIKRSSNIAFNDTHIKHGKGYTVYVQEVNGFKFEHSSLENSGVLGMYIGHTGNASRNIQIQHSLFADNQTNGLALLGVTGSWVGENRVENNVFIRNHRRGQWSVAPQYGSGFTGGGQLYVAQANNVTVNNNTLLDGYCDNCYVQRTFRSGVTGIELGIPNKATVSNVEISNNRVINHDAKGISVNNNSAVNASVRIANNTILNNTKGLSVQNAAVSGNTVASTRSFYSFESGSAVESNVSCSSGGSVARQCGIESRFGNCALQLKLSAANCSGPNAEFNSAQTAVSQGQHVVATGWVNGSAGQWCLIFKDGSANQIGSHCKSIVDSQQSNIQNFVGLPMLEATSPTGTRFVHMRVQLFSPNTQIRVDDLKLSVR
jgi:hypothetical protein